MDHRLIDCLSKKPRLISEFPEWMFPQHTIDEIKKTRKVAIAEIAGRDSIAAVIKAVELRPINAILPTIAYTGTEFGDWNIPYQKCHFLKKRLEGSGIKVYEPVFLGDPEFWHILCGRYLCRFFKNLGFYTPCIGCHLYLHSIRVPLAKMVGSQLLIAGEREHHENRIKLNQISQSLDAYTRFLTKFDIELFLPLRFVTEDKELENILGCHWDENAEQMHCVLSKNYLDINEEVEFYTEAIEKFFNDFAFEQAEKVLNTY